MSLAMRIGERSMSRQTKQTLASPCAPQQIDLFAGALQKTIGDMRVWAGLPRETQAALTHLMTRLILNHADKIRIGSEVGRDL
jgi:hypothetical protein